MSIQETDLRRDSSGALLNQNSSALALYKKQKNEQKLLQKMQLQINSLLVTVSQLESRIKDLENKNV